MRTRATSRLVVSCALTGCVALALAPASVSAQPAACDAWEIEYALSASLRLSDTPLGQGDGIYAIGPGRVVLRFEDHDGQPSGRAQMVAYDMRERFVITSKTLLWTTQVTTDTKTRGTPDTCGVAAEGQLTGNVLGWSGPVRGYRTDGTLTCDGSLCGKFGAPPPGQSDLHIGPGPVQFRPFVFAKDMKTFTMQETLVATTDMPKQKAHLVLAGREARRSCAPAKACH